MAEHVSFLAGIDNSHVVDLGSLTHCLVPKKLAVTTRLVAQITSEHSPVSIAEPKESILDLILSNSIWIQNKPAVKLCFCIRPGGPLLYKDDGYESPTDVLRSMVLEAEIWTQLQLEVQEIQANEPGTEQHDIVLELRQQKPDMDLSCTSQPASILKDWSVSNARPPSEVDMIYLQAIFVDFTFFTDKAIHENTLQKDASPFQILSDSKKHRELTQPTSACQRYTEVERLTDDDVLDTLDSNKERLGNMNLTPESEQLEGSDKLAMLGDMDLGYLDDVLSETCEVSLPHPRIPNQQPVLPKSFDVIFNAPDVAKLLDAATRSILTEFPVSIPKTVLCELHRLAMPLARLCPAMFSHGYLQGLAQRMSLMQTALHLAPDIHEVDGELAEHASSITLFDRFDSAFERRTQALPIGQATLRKDFWLSLHAGLMRPEHSRRLKPLALPEFKRRLNSSKSRELLRDEVHGGRSFEEGLKEVFTRSNIVVDEEENDLKMVDEQKSALRVDDEWDWLLDSQKMGYSECQDCCSLSSMMILDDESELLSSMPSTQNSGPEYQQLSSLSLASSQTAWGHVSETDLLQNDVMQDSAGDIESLEGFHITDIVGHCGSSEPLLETAGVVEEMIDYI